MKLHSTQIGLLLISIALIVTNGFLVWQNINLKHQLKSQTELSQPQQGDVFDKIRITDLAGNKSDIDFSQEKRKTIVYYFRTGCVFCKRQMNYWKNLVSKVDSAKYRVIAVTIEKNSDIIRNFVKDYEVEDWQVFILDQEDARRFKLISTPITVVVGPQGIEEKVWIGLWQGDTLESANDYFGTDFPES